ncbi:MAG TPA: tRNA (adenosine(37)-N6)-threonylcarbamoyltransferase complex dimerization subunit type 1 TsaB [Bacteroidia bacterium]|jgi:tRNA threonylcarbamoyladenosine biosynthesis protein TsaB|nr:tRNA (adenosine(37)-N6)-threonylcarbamoyltransferase complex dimerization subunit type 1 TsaB [Bacteroidia bacterium]
MILLIESSTSICSVALTHDGKIISSRELNEENCHAEKLTVFIDEVMKEAEVNFISLDAVAVSKGPGSYTGLRIGVSAAKGICYAVNKPLIAIGTLDAMAKGMENAECRMQNAEWRMENAILIPMIDARRMEVYSATYDKNGNRLTEVSPLVLDENSIHSQFSILHSPLIFSGDGMPKAKELLSQLPNANFTESGMPSAKNLASLAEKYFSEKKFEDLAYFEPFYLKTFHPGPQRSKSE